MTQPREMPAHMDRIGGTIQLDNYKGSNISLDDFELDLLLDDTLLVEYMDGNSEEVVKGGVILKQTVDGKTWRIGKILLSGEKCQYLKNGDYVLFPNDRGLPARNIIFKGEKKPEVIFLSENRVFGRLAKK